MFQGGCGHFGGPQIKSYSPALQQLFDEHPSLRAQMEQLVEKGKKLMDAPSEQWRSGLEELSRLEAKFKSELDPHSEKEEGGLFPMLAKYIGRAGGPIAVMEYEHNEAKKYLGLFEQRVNNLKEDVTKEDVTAITSLVIQACNILFDHFMKEENVLFPMAERTLNDEEKEELLKIVKG